jgi:HEAT repeat protein
MSAETDLAAIFEAERAIRAAEQRLLEAPEKKLAALLASAVREARGLDDREEATLRLHRLADLCAQVPGPQMADALIDILDDEDPAVRAEAADALLDVGYERYAEVARAIERALDARRTGPVMEELPFFLAEIAEPSALPLIERFMKHPRKEVVAAAIEAMSELGDPAAVEILEGFVDDPREVFLDGEDDEVTKGTLGELARDAIESLGG